MKNAVEESSITACINNVDISSITQKLSTSSMCNMRGIEQKKGFEGSDEAETGHFGGRKDRFYYLFRF